MEFRVPDISLPAGLSEHFHHPGLEHRVHGFNADSGTTLRHSKHIHHANCVLIDEFTQHKTHNFHRDTCAAMS